MKAAFFTIFFWKKLQWICLALEFGVSIFQKSILSDIEIILRMEMFKYQLCGCFCSQFHLRLTQKWHTAAQIQTPIFWTFPCFWQKIVQWGKYFWSKYLFAFSQFWSNVNQNMANAISCKKTFYSTFKNIQFQNFLESPKKGPTYIEFLKFCNENNLSVWDKKLFCSIVNQKMANAISCKKVSSFICQNNQIWETF